MTAVAHAAAAFACAMLTLAMTATTNASPTMHKTKELHRHHHSAHAHRHAARRVHHPRRAAHRAGHRHRMADPPRAGMSTVCAAAGCSRVIASARERFQGLIHDLQAMGYDVGHPGCLSSGHMRHSLHHSGRACDLFDQTARDRCRLRQPPPAVQIAIAEKHGLRSGCAWHDRDCGHFEERPQVATRHVNRRYASAGRQ